MASKTDNFSPTYLTDFNAYIDRSTPHELDDLLNDVTITEVSLSESLLTPGLQSSLILQSTLNNPRISWNDVWSPVKNLDKYYGRTLRIAAGRQVLKDLYGDNFKWNFNTKQKIYRLSARHRVSNEIEQFQLDACDPSLITDGKTYYNGSFKGVTPDNVVNTILHHCFSDINAEIEPANPRRDYVAMNIHPFQAISQQGEVALVQDGKIDPSFVHFMTYQTTNHDDIPTHNFRSLTKMAEQDPIFTFGYSAKGIPENNYADPHDIMSYDFPCDFDLLSDVLNGLDNVTGKAFTQMNNWNPITNNLSLYGPKESDNECGTAPWLNMTNSGTETTQNSTSLSPESYQLLRKARIGMLDQNRIALRMVLPFSPFLNVGRTIDIKLYNTKDGSLLYGSGKYMIVNMTHNLKLGGFGITSLECVSNSISEGRV